MRTEWDDFKEGRPSNLQALLINQGLGRLMPDEFGYVKYIALLLRGRSVADLAFRPDWFDEFPRKVLILAAAIPASIELRKIDQLVDIGRLKLRV